MRERGSSNSSSLLPLRGAVSSTRDWSSLSGRSADWVAILESVKRIVCYFKVNNRLKTHFHTSNSLIPTTYLNIYSKTNNNNNNNNT